MSYYVNVALFIEVTQVAITAVLEMDTTSVCFFFLMMIELFSVQLLQDGILILFTFKGIIQFVNTLYL